MVTAPLLFPCPQRNPNLKTSTFNLPAQEGSTPAMTFAHPFRDSQYHRMTPTPQQADPEALGIHQGKPEAIFSGRDQSIHAVPFFHSRSQNIQWTNQNILDSFPSASKHVEQDTQLFSNFLAHQSSSTNAPYPPLGGKHDYQSLLHGSQREDKLSPEAVFPIKGTFPIRDSISSCSASVVVNLLLN